MTSSSSSSSGAVFLGAVGVLVFLGGVATAGLTRVGGRTQALPGFGV